ncbi:Uncharacterized protein DAT39_010168 [Clarias magur]|uniref:Uncharacterized protein n=1 Tax=Clarias magur TaxID=1594786 RepID=A0A8J4U4Y4_CLAMG|nr:Uncharacterized protein DAT39_010168 [Clarias magur]
MDLRKDEQEVTGGAVELALLVVDRGNAPLCLVMRSLALLPLDGSISVGALRRLPVTLTFSAVFM